MKIFITGANGALGTDMQQELKKQGVHFIATDINQLDIGNFRATKESIQKHRPDVILHFAAISDVDECERNPDLAYQVNVLGTLGLAASAEKIDARLLYVSTNFVFDGKREAPYNEYSQPNPINVYGKTKYLGEQITRDICSRYTIIRTSWLFGRKSKTYMSRFITKQEKPVSIDAICDQFGSYTYTVDLASVIFQLVKLDYNGIYHIINQGSGSWLDFALKAKEILRSKTEIKTVKTEELDLPAARPRYAPLVSQHLEFLLGTKMRTWEQALGAYIKTLQAS